MKKRAKLSKVTPELLEAARADGVEEVVLLTTTAEDFFGRKFGFEMSGRDAYGGARPFTRVEPAALLQRRPDEAQPQGRVEPGSEITAAYRFTESTSFASPAVTVARSLSDNFAGIRPADGPGFIAAQFPGPRRRRRSSLISRSCVLRRS